MATRNGKFSFFCPSSPSFIILVWNQIWQKVIWNLNFRCFDQIECNSNKIITLHCIEGACYCQAWVQIPNQVPNPLKSIPNWEQKSIQEPPSPWESWHEKGYFLSLLIIAFWKNNHNDNLPLSLWNYWNLITMSLPCRHQRFIWCNPIFSFLEKHLNLRLFPWKQHITYKLQYY